jgi:hypothetical protein
VRGLSSAASIWFTAALGVTVAVSSPVPVLMALGLALITLSVRDDGRTVDTGEAVPPSAESLRLGPFSAPLRWPIDGAAPVWGTGSGLNYPEDMKKAANPAGNQGIVSLRADVPAALHDAMRGFIESHPHLGSIPVVSGRPRRFPGAARIRRSCCDPVVSGLIVPRPGGLHHQARPAGCLARRP